MTWKEHVTTPDHIKIVKRKKANTLYGLKRTNPKTVCMLGAKIVIRLMIL